MLLEMKKKTAGMIGKLKKNLLPFERDETTLSFLLIAVDHAPYPRKLQYRTVLE